MSEQNTVETMEELVASDNPSLNGDLAAPEVIEDEAPKKKKKKKKKDKVADEAPVEEAKEKVKVKKDKFGCRLGTRAAKLNAAITSKPRLPAEIADAADYHKAVYPHLSAMLRKGFIKRDKEGKYFEAPKKDKGPKNRVKDAVSETAAVGS